MFIAGKIINTHGIKGEVKVQQITDFPERFEIGNTVYAVNQENEAIPLTIDGFRSHKNNLLLHFEGYDSIDDALRLKGLDLKIKASQQEELGKNEYYYHEIIGAKVFATDGEEIGVVESILSPGANDVWVVLDKNKKEILIPYIEPVVKEVDVQNKKIMIELMEGLLE